MNKDNRQFPFLLKKEALSVNSNAAPGADENGDEEDDAHDEEFLGALVDRQLRSLPRDELQKAQLDRSYIAKVLRETLEEICKKKRLRDILACIRFDSVIT